MSPWFIAMLLMTWPAHAQQQDQSEPQPVFERHIIGDVEIIIRGGDVIIIENDGGAFITTPRNWSMQDDPIPPDHALQRIPIDSSVRELIDSLDAADYAERERATRAIVDLRIGNEQLYAALAQDGLSPEQRHRLLAAVRERLLHMPRGALGINMAQRDEQGGVLVTDLIPGMPAERVLRIGDRIVGVEGASAADSTELVRLVQSRRPGDEVALTVRRPRRDEAGRMMHGEGDVIEIRLTLGSTHQLFDNRRLPATNPLEPERRREAAWVQERFAPATRVIRIETD